jgi:hypothetical protein
VGGRESLAVDGIGGFARRPYALAHSTPVIPRIVVASVSARASVSVSAVLVFVVMITGIALFGPTTDLEILRS